MVATGRRPAVLRSPAAPLRLVACRERLSARPRSASALRSGAVPDSVCARLGSLVAAVGIGPRWLGCCRSSSGVGPTLVRSGRSCTRRGVLRTRWGSPGRRGRGSRRSRLGWSRGCGARAIPVAVLAIDPSSPFSGGAILGDRVRMQDHDLDEGVFIRSMATRGHLGGLALAVPEAVRVLDAAGYPWVVVETVGVGPGRGRGRRGRRHHRRRREPGVGRRRAGGQGRAPRDRRRVRGQQGRPSRRRRRRARPGEHPRDGRRSRSGLDPADRAHGGDDRRRGRGACGPPIAAHRTHLESSGGLDERRAARIEAELRAILVARVLERVGAAEGDQRFAERAAAVAAREVDPWSATDDLLD